MDGDLGREIVGEIVQLPSAADRHQDAGGAFLDCRFNDGDRIEDRLERTAQVQAIGDGKAALNALLEERGAKREKHADGRAALRAVECPQLN